jgi:hypothetical protein
MKPNPCTAVYPAVQHYESALPQPVRFSIGIYSSALFVGRLFLEGVTGSGYDSLERHAPGTGAAFAVE